MLYRQNSESGLLDSKLPPETHCELKYMCVVIRYVSDILCHLYELKDSHNNIGKAVRLYAILAQSLSLFSRFVK